MIVVIAFVALHLGLILVGKRLEAKTWSVSTVGAIIGLAQTIFLVLYLTFMQMPPLR